MINEKLKQRFLKYISFDTQSCDESNTIPSTMKQKDLGEYLANELSSFGLSEAFMDEHGYVYAYIPSNCGSENTLGLIAHLDTSDEASGKNVIIRFGYSILLFNSSSTTVIIIAIPALSSAPNKVVPSVVIR